ncbi:MAG: hypothetical protein LBV43_13165 [Prevotella sp.]|jgi:hypothetical protein|nr:hypothetical protein [Prevotella sp.]
MYKYIILIPAFVGLVSCSSLFNGGKARIFLYTEDEAKIVYREDTLATMKSEAYNTVSFPVPRSSKDINLMVFTDLHPEGRLINVPSKTSLSFYANFWSPFFTGFLIDLTNDQRYTYKDPILLDDNLNVITKMPSLQRQHFIKYQNKRSGLEKIKERELPKKGDLYMNINLPYINSFYLQPDFEGEKNSFGFLGFGMGLDYYYSNNNFLNLTIAAAMDFEIPFPTHIDYGGGTDENASSFYLLLTHNHRYKKFSYGYGLSLARNLWVFDDYDIDIRIRKFDTTAGLAFNSYYYFSNKFTIGLNYRPTFVLLNTKSDQTFRYEHQIGVDFAFKISLNK